MKKLLVSLLIGISSVGLIGCNGATSSEEPYTSTSEEQVQESQQDEQEISINDFALEGKIDDSMKTLYYVGKVTNNSKFIMKDATFKYEYTNEKGDRDITFLHFNDTLLQGETSHVDECFYSDDMVLKRIDVTLIDKEGNREIELKHDIKLNETTIEEFKLQ